MKKSNSIKVQLLGGLGNQLFGLHFGAAVSSQLNIELQISDSMIALGSNKSRSLQILNFKFIKASLRTYLLIFKGLN